MTRADDTVVPVYVDSLAIGPGRRPIIVAELSGNHAGDRGRALAMVDAAIDAGADAVKLQTYRPDGITLDHDGDAFRVASPLWRGQTLYRLYQRAQTPWDWHAALFEHARARGVSIFSSPFDLEAVDLLESLDCPAYKIASFELVDTGLIERVAATGKPVILSAGMATMAEIDEAVGIVRRHGDGRCVVLHCTSSYPAPIDQANLDTIPALAGRLRLPVGFSDHTEGATAAIAAVALGACLVEKHFTLDDDGAVDEAFSLRPDGFRALVDACRDGWLARGAVRDGPFAAEVDEVRFRRSLYAVADIPAGGLIDSGNVRSIRPAGGLHPRELRALTGCRARQHIARGTPMHWDLVERVEGGADG